MKLRDVVLLLVASAMMGFILHKKQALLTPPSPSPTPTATASATATPEASGVWRDERDPVAVVVEQQEKEARARARLPKEVLDAQAKAQALVDGKKEYRIRDVRLVDGGERIDVVAEPLANFGLVTTYEEMALGRINLTVRYSSPAYNDFRLLAPSDYVTFEVRLTSAEKVEQAAMDTFLTGDLGWTDDMTAYLTPRVIGRDDQ